MDTDRLRGLLAGIRDGSVSDEEALAALERLPFEDLGFACVDTHRALRQGVPEVIFCQGKTAEQVVGIISSLRARGQRVLASRASRDVYAAVQQAHPSAVYHEPARMITVGDPAPSASRGRIAVVCAGTSDIPVAEEAAVTARTLGNPVDTVYDVGVAGLHRLLLRREAILGATVVIVVAGMEGALASVVGGMVRVPVIAVPTSIGYGASFQGLAALLAMLNSCAAGVVVVNIDNGFGAGYAASLINRRYEPGGENEEGQP